MSAARVNIVTRTTLGKTALVQESLGVIAEDDLEFENALKIFDTPTGGTTQFWFAASTMNQAAIANRDTPTGDR